MTTYQQRYADYQEQLKRLDRGIRKTLVCCDLLAREGIYPDGKSVFMKLFTELTEYREIYAVRGLDLAARMRNEQKVQADTEPFTTCELAPSRKPYSPKNPDELKQYGAVVQRLSESPEIKSLVHVDRIYTSFLIENPRLKVLAGDKGL